jgi:prepilin-type N-terminal cleavage/methylation domain-containing protein
MNQKSRKLKAESRFGSESMSALRTRVSLSAFRFRRTRRRGMTLIELLITMVIIAIISAAILGTASAAFENARRSRTQSLITKISGLVLERWDSYANRRVDIHPTIVAGIEGLDPTQVSAAERGQMLVDARLLALRELMLMEMPDSWADLNRNPLVLANVPALARSYQRHYATGHEDDHESAECLYLTVMNATGDGEARTLFSTQDIGDTDGDGAPEFIDGWGRSIGWCRWPAGVISDMQALGADGTRPGEADHDSFDVFHRDSPTVLTPPIDKYPGSFGFRQTYQDNLRKRMTQAGPGVNSKFLAYRLVPLVFSAGPDGGAGLRFFDVVEKPLDPYAVGGSNLQNGEIDTTSEFTSKDNITNHLIQY